MNSSTPYVAIKSINGTVYVVIRQERRDEQLKTNIDLIMNQEQFSGLMYALKAIERQFIEDHTRTMVNEAVENTLTLDSFVESYDPTKPALGLDDSKRKKPKPKNVKDSNP